MARKVSIDYTLAAARIFNQHLTPENNKGEKFRFVYCSGAAAERDQTKSLWFAQEFRRIRVCFYIYPLPYMKLAVPCFSGCVPLDLTS